MSLILEALKKSDQKRYHGRAPNLHGVLGGQPFEPPFVDKMRFGVMLAVGLNVVFFVGVACWFAGSKESRGPVVSLGGAADHLKAPKTRGVAADERRRSKGAGLPLVDPVVRAWNFGENVLISQGKKIHSRISKDPARFLSQAKMPAPMTNLPKVEPVLSMRGAEGPETLTEEKATAVSIVGDMGRSVESNKRMANDVAEIHLSALFYSEKPESRFICVNGILLREGQFLPPGLRVEEIVSGGVFFVRDSTRFFVKMY